MSIMEELKRVLFDTATVILFLIVFATYFYQYFPNPLQLVAYDIYVRSVAILQAHISRKLLFPKVNWQSPMIKPLHILVIGWYLMFLFTAK